MALTQGAGAHLSNDQKRAHLTDMPLADLRNHIASACERMLNKAGTDLCGISYPELMKAYLDTKNAGMS